MVRPPGFPSRAKRAPNAASTLSGQPSPLDELTDTTSPSRTNCADCSAVITLFMRTRRLTETHRRAMAGPCRLEHCERGGKRTHAILAGGRWFALTAHGGDECAHSAQVQILVIERQLAFALCVAQRHRADWTLGHDVASDDGTFRSVNFQASAGELDSKGVVKLRDRVVVEVQHGHYTVLEVAMRHSSLLRERNRFDRFGPEDETQGICIVNGDIQNDAGPARRFAQAPT